MSLINQMLEDLEQRRAGHPLPVSTVLAGTVPAQAGSRKSWHTRFTGGLLVLVCLSGIVWWQGMPVPVDGKVQDNFAPLRDGLEEKVRNSIPAQVVEGVGTEEKPTATVLPQATLYRIRLAGRGTGTRVVFDLDRAPVHRLTYDEEAGDLNLILEETRSKSASALGIRNNRLVETLTAVPREADLIVRLVLNQPVEVRVFTLEQVGDPSHRLVADLIPYPVKRVFSDLSDHRPMAGDGSTPRRSYAPSLILDDDVLTIPTTPKRAGGTTDGEVLGEVSLPRSLPAVKKSLRPLSGMQLAEQSYQGALGLLAQGDPQGAEDSLRSALTQASDHLDSRYTLAALLMNAGRTGEASGLLDEGLRTQPGHAPMARLYGRLKAEGGQPAVAIRVMEKALANAHGDPEYHAQLAALYQRLGRHGEALARYREALEERPTASVWWLGIGISLEGIRKPQQAVAAYRRAVASGSLSSGTLVYAQERLRVLEKRRF